MGGFASTKILMGRFGLCKPDSLGSEGWNEVDYS
jgi:hypothetical protein